MFASAFLRVIIFQGVKARLEFMLGSRDEYAHFTVRKYLREIVEFIVEFGLGIPFECVEIGGKDPVLTKQKGYRSSREGIAHLALECHDFAVLYFTLDEFSVASFMVAIGHKIAVLAFRFPKHALIIPLRYLRAGRPCPYGDCRSARVHTCRISQLHGCGVARISEFPPGSIAP